MRGELGVVLTPDLHWELSLHPADVLLPHLPRPDLSLHLSSLPRIPAEHQEAGREAIQSKKRTVLGRCKSVRTVLGRCKSVRTVLGRCKSVRLVVVFTALPTILTLILPLDNISTASQFYQRDSFLFSDN